jgi:transketolase
MSDRARRADARRLDALLGSLRRTGGIYRRSLLPPLVTARVAVEEASPLGRDRYVGPAGTVVAMRGFRASARGDALEKRFGFTVEAVVDAALDQLRRSNEKD